MPAETAAIVVTACGKRKSLTPVQRLHAASLESGTTASVAREWAARLREATVRAPAHALYQGRGFREAERAASRLGNTMYVLSAGLGLIPVDDAIPSYALTVAGGADNVLAKLPSGEASPGDWWREFTRISGSLTFSAVMEASTGPVLIAAGSAYLGMIGDDLAALKPDQQTRIRLFTAGSGEALQQALKPLVMPYDRRLESLPNRSGTMSDFAQRALRHFAETILPDTQGTGPEAHASAVSGALNGVQMPAKHRGRSIGDDQIIGLILAHWEATGGKSAAMLRAFRDSFGVACEQKRFKKLFAAARLERTA